MRNGTNRDIMRTLLPATLSCLLLTCSSLALAQRALDEESADDSTIVYPADYFAEYYPVSANDMLSRIPGIDLALRGGGGGGRGLGSGAGEILINGQRITGKNNEGRAQLNRIAAEQVQYIEIIRGTSEELDVRGGGQVVNVVLLDTPTSSSTTVQLRTDYLRDGTIDPGGQLSYSGQSGDLNYLLAVEADPRYRVWESNEYSYNALNELGEVRRENRERDETEYSTSANLGYNFGRSSVQLNALYETRGEVPDNTLRSIHDLVEDSLRYQNEQNINTRDAWELGGDFQYDFANAGTYRALFIVNDRDSMTTRNRFNVVDGENVPNLFTESGGRDRERIVRTSYTFDWSGSQGLELGIEGAQTIRNNSLRLGVEGDESERRPEYGNLVPVEVSNANTTVEEIRYEPFANHNWQLSNRMSLESSLVYESSTIEQSGDVSNSRSFQFLRPRVDYRFDISPSFQLRASVRKDVDQLSFSDFSTSVDGGDEDQNTQAGNPDIRQEQSWRYELNFEMRLPDDLGVVNSQFWYRDVEDHIDRIDVSTGPDDLESARGNIGDGKRYGLNLDMSTKLDGLGIDNALLTTGVRLRDSEFVDPFLGIKRRQRGNGRWEANVGFRHDVITHGLTYGFNYRNQSNGGTGRLAIDVDDIEETIESPWLSAYVEKRAFGNFIFRLESNNITEADWCRKRTRFVGATSLGIVEEVEDFCNGSGMELALRVRTTF
jgi:hypothetical protein